MKVTWIGHSCFKVEAENWSVVFDPSEDGYVPGIKPMREEADFVICSHDHGDHNAADLIKLTGRKPDLKITTIHTFHDEEEGALRGVNDISIVDDGKCRIAHFGDLGCMPTEEQLETLTGLDLVMIPVGGYYTIDGEMAAKIIKTIEPKVVIPMHFRDEDLGFGFDVISTVEPFCYYMGSRDTINYCEVEIDFAQLPGEDITVLVLKPKNLEN